VYESIEQRTRHARVGAIIFGVAVVIAIVLIGLRFGSGGGDGETPPSRETVSPSNGTRIVETPPPFAPETPAAVTPPPTPALAPDGAPMADDRWIVCIDPGHGGEDLGHVRTEGGQIIIQEKDLTLAHALMLGDRLTARGIEVVYTRASDIEINMHNLDINGDGTVAPPGDGPRSDEADDLQARVTICNKAGADLLVSIHYNGAENRSLEGYEVWYNDQRPFSGRSLRLAQLVHDQLGQRLADAGYDAVDRGVQNKDLAVLAPERPGKLDPSRMPGVLIEGLFLSNTADAAFMVTDVAADALVTAYEVAILQYFDEYPG
jgi:N-acetylmuramoyl-L-alanine amidase